MAGTWEVGGKSRSGTAGKGRVRLQPPIHPGEALETRGHWEQDRESPE